MGVVFAAVVALSPSSTALAKLSESQLNMFSQNNILFYDPTSSDSCAPTAITGDKVTLIGDSISVRSQGQFSSQIPNIDFEAKTFDGVTYNLTEVSKHFVSNAGTNYGGLTIAQVLQEQGELKPFVVFALGTNDAGGVSETTIGQLMDLVGTNHRVVLVTNYGTDIDFSSNNAAIKAAASKYSNVAVADWEAEVSKDAGKYLDDHVYPNAAGQELFVRLIKSALNTLTGSGSGATTGSNKNYAGAEVWSETEMAAIQANMPIYREAAEQFNFPWQILAVLHSHETGLRRYNPSNGQGVYQLYSYTAGGTNANRFEPADEISEEEFRRQTIIAAEVVSGMVGDLNDTGNIKRLFFQYNGTAQVYIDKAIQMGFSEEEARNGEGSAYVMNRYDEQRDPTSAGMSPLWPGRFVGDGVYDSSSTSNGFGAFVQYEALAGASYCSTGGGSIVDTAILLSWEGNRSHSINDPKPEYVEAMKAVDTYRDPCGANGVCPPKGASCDQFVSTVMRYSGSDPNFPVFGPGVQYEYMKKNTSMYMEVDYQQDVANLQPGDILVIPGEHIYLYIGEINGQPSQASASWNDRTGEHYPGVYFTQNGAVFSAFRRIN